MMSPDHICESPNWPAGRSLYMLTVTFGRVASRISSIAVRMPSITSGSSALTSWLPSRSIGSAMRCASRR